MTLEQPPSRFGAASPGARPAPPALEPLLTAPPVRRRRVTGRRVLAFFVVLVIAAGAAVAGHFLWPRPAPAALAQVVVTTAAIPQGGKIAADELEVLRVHPGATVPTGALSPAEATNLIGKVAQQTLPAGTFLTAGLVGPAGALPNPEQRLMGLSLKSGQEPANGVHVGEQVGVVALRSNSQGTRMTSIPIATTTVWGVGKTDSDGNTPVSIVVPTRLYNILSAYASQQDVVIAESDTPAPAPSSSAPKPTHTASRKPSHKGSAHKRSAHKRSAHKSSSHKKQASHKHR